MNLKISRVGVRRFKAFKSVDLDFNNANLVSLDGPNGFGKTTIFEAIELLLTGRIRRINNLFNTLFTKSKTNYEDSLLWNTRSGKSDLTIKVEFSVPGGLIVLARHAAMSAFATKTNNRADQFEHFDLYELPTFESEDFIAENRRDNNYLDDLFDKNFRENFNFLNYLEQGQSQFLHTRVDERKNALGGLFDTQELTQEIDNCKTLESKLTRYLTSADRKKREESLSSEIKLLSDANESDFGSPIYGKISTSSLTPTWDLIDPFAAFSIEIKNRFLATIQTLIDLSLIKPTMRASIENQKIESFISDNMDAFRGLAILGNDWSRLDELNGVKKEIAKYSSALRAIDKGSSDLSVDEARFIPNLSPELSTWFEVQIGLRNDLNLKNEANEKIIAELARLKLDLMSHQDMLNPSDSNCPLCGFDWGARSLLLEAVEARRLSIDSSLGQNAAALVDVIRSMSARLSEFRPIVQARLIQLESTYDSKLHNMLIQLKSRLLSIENLFDYVQKLDYTIDFEFTQDESLREERFESLVAFVRLKKTGEDITLPEGWRTLIDSVFVDVEDFFKLESQVFMDKMNFVRMKAQEVQNSRLQKYQNELEVFRNQNKAAQASKDKIVRLKKSLLEVERDYTSATISEIELIFHLYSGRLIQNYQRGLGLFIESESGKKLRFLTAEKSDHDALMSMSTGQVSALSLAFFLSLNRVYSDVPIILIDDPSQSLDDINIASLTDLLRCELKNSQLIVSSHEEDFSSFMRYRFGRAGLTTKSLNMQKMAIESA